MAPLVSWFLCYAVFSAAFRGMEMMSSSGSEVYRSSPARSRRNQQRMIRHRLTHSVRKLLTYRSSLRKQTSLPEEVPPVLSFGIFLQNFLDTSELPLALFYRALLEPCVGSKERRQRNLFPLPPIRQWSDDSVDRRNLPAHLTCANLCVAALNFLDEGMPQKPGLVRPPGRCSAAQRAVHSHVMQRTSRFLSRLAAASGARFNWVGSFDQHEDSGKSRYEKLRGNDVDLPVCAGTCDPAKLVRRQLWEAAGNPNCVFPDCTAEPAGLQALRGRDRQEYLRLTLRELHCGKLRLRFSVKGLANVFAAPKANKGRQRKIWDGSVLSEAAARPPKPYRLANPSTFLDILLRPGEELFLSKRDASTFFDSLKVPLRMQEWFGQPPVQVRELLAAGLRLPEVLAKTDGLGQASLTDDSFLYPVNVVWPMGFSWSSCVAQETSIGCLREAGVKEHSILSLDNKLPVAQEELCAVATDDVMFFHRHRDRGLRTLGRLDSVFRSRGVVKNKSKDVTLEATMTGLGCDISSTPPLVEPSMDKLGRVVPCMCDLLTRKVASPKAFNSLLGMLQWFCLLQRSMFSVFDKSYGFVQQPAPAKRRSLPEAVQLELLQMLALMPLLPAALDRQFLDTLLACDAAPEFGFGVCAAKCGRRLVQQVGRLAERQGDYVRLLPNPGMTEKPRLGVMHRLPLKPTQFKTLISCKAQKPAHSGLLECHGVLLTLKWVGRDVKRHHSRLRHKHYGESFAVWFLKGSADSASDVADTAADALFCWLGAVQSNMWAAICAQSRTNSFLHRFVAF
ncbi:hypothetical protein AK812_SmicGene46529 [Symbiodinium microadriaticum]|uniref:Uncharacterized protein n=1 Tax=Symbiodinium microadriaticum TaxID=2951 RepID=A0A1Q9BTP9_SYMMI|nr:hypothetical protein AK812_SmicGene46529 [Symbiodinium microadriaticum]